MLLQRYISYAQSQPHCGAIYLHVITYNVAAIRLYEKAGFVFIKEVPDYYRISGNLYSCYLYVKYINGAVPGPVDVNAIDIDVSDSFGDDTLTALQIAVQASSTALHTVAGTLSRLLSIVWGWISTSSNSQQQSNSKQQQSSKQSSNVDATDAADSIV
jgi:Acetyltransferase (GNAT) family